MANEVMNQEAEKVVERATSTTGLTIGVIGIGNAGSQVAMRAFKAKHDAICINSSVKDLDNSVLGATIPALKIGDGRGSGKTRANAMALLKSGGNQSVKDILLHPRFRGVVEPADVVFVIFSTGGGTGSGIGPYMAETLRKAYKGKLVISYGILPILAESVLAQANTIACVNEMAEGSGPYMLADLEFYSKLPLEKAYDQVADFMVETLNIIRGDHFEMSTAGMADERDVMTVISNPGYMVAQMLGDITENQDGKTLQGHLIDQFKSSPAARCQHDGRVVMDLMIANVPAQYEDPMKMGDFRELHEYIGEPKASFLHYAVNNSRATAEVMCICSGMSVPMDRFAAPRAKVAANKDKYSTHEGPSLKKDASVATEFGGGGNQSIIMGSKQSSEADLSFLD